MHYNYTKCKIKRKILRSSGNYPTILLSLTSKFPSDFRLEHSSRDTLLSTIFESYFDEKAFSHPCPSTRRGVFEGTSLLNEACENDYTRQGCKTRARARPRLPRRGIHREIKRPIRYRPYYNPFEARQGRKEGRNERTNGRIKSEKKNEKKEERERGE